MEPTICRFTIHEADSNDQSWHAHTCRLGGPYLNESIIITDCSFLPKPIRCACGVFS